MADQLIPIDGIQVSRVGLTITGDLSFEEWMDIGHTLAGLEVSLRWAIGDWLNWGNFKYGESYTQASDVTGFDYSYLYNLKYIAGKVDISRRREELHLSHHQVVAPLSPDEQDRWLDYAVANNLRTAELRQAIKEFSGETKPETRENDATRAVQMESLVISYIRGLEANKSEIYKDAYNRLREMVKDKL